MIDFLNKKHIVALMLMMALWACGNRNESTQPTVDYTVCCKLDKKVVKDSATLYVVDNTLKRKRMLGKLGQKDYMFTFTGQIDEPHVAIIKFKKEKTPFYFVLEPGVTKIEFTARQVIVSGGRQNHTYFQFINAIKSLQKQRKDNFKAYRKAANDSLLNAKTEEAYRQADHQLFDSIQSVCLSHMNAGNQASLIIRERYLNLLSNRSVTGITR